MLAASVADFIYSVIAKPISKQSASWRSKGPRHLPHVAFDVLGRDVAFARTVHSLKGGIRLERVESAAGLACDFDSLLTLSNKSEQLA